MKMNKFGKLAVKKLKIAIVQARFNEKITDGLAEGALRGLKLAGVLEKDIEYFKVPGSFEIPLACKRIAKSKKFDGIVALGAVIKGETAHFEYISGETVSGIMKTILEENFPIALGVITPLNLKQAQARAKNDDNNKGYEAALSLVELLETLKGI